MPEVVLLAELGHLSSQGVCTGLTQVFLADVLLQTSVCAFRFLTYLQMPMGVRLPKNTEEVCGREGTSPRGRDPDRAEQ